MRERERDVSMHFKTASLRFESCLATYVLGNGFSLQGPNQSKAVSPLLVVMDHLATGRADCWNVKQNSQLLAHYESFLHSGLHVSMTSGVW